VILISIDTLRRDHVSAYGYERETTPNIDALARRGVLFSNASSTTNWTLPAHVSMLTGLMPSTHGVEDKTDALAESTRTLADVLRARGLHTGGFASHVYLKAKYGFAKGFDTYDVEPDRRAEGTTARALEWLAQRGDAPFFLFVHYFDPHWPYRAPAPHGQAFGDADFELGTLAKLYPYYSTPMPADVARDVKKLYDGEIFYTDHHVGRIIAWLEEHDRSGSTVIAVTSDHGEEFGDHGGFGHARHLHTEVTSVPLVIVPAEAPPGSEEPQWPARYDGAVSIADLPATLLALARTAPEPQFQREAEAIMPGTAPHRDVIAEATHRGPKRFAIRRDGERYFSAGQHLPIAFDTEVRRIPLVPTPIETAFYDIASDPDEQRNLYPVDPMRAAPLRAALEQFIVRTMRGVMLQCVVEPGDALRATASFDAEPFDEPFALTPGATVSVDEEDVRRFHVSMIGTGATAAVVFPVRAREVSFELEASLEAKTTIPLPGPGTRTELAGAGGAAESCAVIGGATTADHARAVLTAAERDQLRALGYGD
jgi:arylsulfatase A-like enzyme